LIRALVLLAALTGPACGETLRIAAWNIGLSRDGPGLLLNDFGKNTDEITAIVNAIASSAADVILLSGFDNDFENLAATALRDQLALAGQDYSYLLALNGNEGVPSGLDLDGDGRLNGWNDNWGFGKFQGHDSMVLLSRLPVEATRSWTKFLWSDLPGARLPSTSSGPFPNADIAAQLRLSSHSHWDVGLQLDDSFLHLLISNPTPPVFDGPEDTNGLRNNDEIAFWLHYLGGAALLDDAGDAAPFSGQAFVVLGDLNADPARGDGIGTALRALLADPRLIVPAQLQGPTAYWESLPPMRVDYILPSADLDILDGGTAAAVDEAATAHRLIWLDVTTGG